MDEYAFVLTLRTNNTPSVLVTDDILELKRYDKKVT
jgi:hypothetical protein